MHARVRQMLETFYTYVYFVEQHGISVCQATNKYQVVGSSLKRYRNKLAISYMYSAFRLTSFSLRKAYLCVIIIIKMKLSTGVMFDKVLLNKVGFAERKSRVSLKLRAVQAASH